MLFCKKLSLICKKCRENFHSNKTFLNHISICQVEEKIEPTQREPTQREAVQREPTQRDNNSTDLSRVDENVITFGKYKGENLETILKKRDYCRWLIKQTWFREQQPYLFNRISEYDPKKYFLKHIIPITTNNPINDFIHNFPYFHTIPSTKLEIKLNEDERKCYKFYRKQIEKIKNLIEDELTFNIKAPTSWLKNFEENTGLNREIFKEFISSYELPNITTIIEKIREEGGFVYKGAQAYKIAKARSEVQEKYWENILKEFYGEEISSQLPFEFSRFDFIRLKAKIIYECKLNIKDFNEEQYHKYQKAAAGMFSIIYLIDTDCIIDINKKTLFTTDKEKYRNYILNIKKPTLFDNLIKDFHILKIGDIKDYF